MKLLKQRISIHLILLLVTVTVLVLPLSGLHLMKLYESALIRQTESELISQGAFISATYKQEIRRQLEKSHHSWETFGQSLPAVTDASQPLHLVAAHLDLAKDPIYPPRPNGKPALQPVNPVSHEAGRHIIPILQDAQQTTLSGMKILDSQGIAIAGQQELGQSFAHLPEVQKAMRGQHVSMLRQRILKSEGPALTSISRGAQMNVYVTCPIVLNGRLIGVVLLNRTPMDLMKVIYTKRRELRLALFLVLFATLGIAVLTSFTITRPIHALIKQARQVTSGSKEAIQPIRQPVTQEIALLSESLSEMAKTIQHRSEYIRNFATSVSHEFKTPLTAIQGSIELLQEHWETMITEQRNRFLSNIGQDTERLKRLVTRVLELARADTLEPIRTQSAILPVLQTLSSRYSDLGLHVTLLNQLPAEHPEVPLPQEILETVFTTLWDNSVQQGATQSEVVLRLQDSHLLIAVSDNGPGISEKNREQIFAPFFTTQRDKGGTGLGLSITRQLLDTYGAQIVLMPSREGAKFHVTLPVVRP